MDLNQKIEYLKKRDIEAEYNMNKLSQLYEMSVTIEEDKLIQEI